jgi:hypothetical protein
MPIPEAARPMMVSMARAGMRGTGSKPCASSGASAAVVAGSWSGGDMMSVCPSSWPIVIVAWPANGCAELTIATSRSRPRGTEDKCSAPAPLSDDFALSGTQDPAMVAAGAWPVEYHPGAGKPSQWEMIAGPGYYGIPLDALISRDTANLFAAGRLLDGERKAAASLRVMGTSFATGQAAGAAAAAQHSPGSPDLHAVQAELQRQDARLPLGAA